MITSYGTPFDPYGPSKSRGVTKKVFVYGTKQKLNVFASCWVVLIPVGTFVGIAAALSFSMHYYKAFFSYAIVFALLLVVLVLGFYAARQWRAKMKGQMREPNWSIFLFLTTALSWIAGVALGEYNYYENLSSYYQIIDLNSYTDIDPTEYTGEELMDAGRIIFTNGSHVDATLSGGFKNSYIYCVAPITTYESTSTYDFWAVGIGCCSGTSPDFHCDDYKKADAHSGLRLLDDSDRPYYRLAVQAAESAHNIRATFPLYFTWQEEFSLESDKETSVKVFVYGSIFWTILMLLLTTAAIITLMRMQG